MTIPGDRIVAGIGTSVVVAVLAAAVLVMHSDKKPTLPQASGKGLIYIRTYEGKCWSEGLDAKGKHVAAFIPCTDHPLPQLDPSK